MFVVIKMRYKNIAGRFFELVTKHACDRRTDAQDRASIAASHGNRPNNHSGTISVHFTRASVFMVALCNRADHYIFMLWFVLSFFFLSSFFPRLISVVGHWMFTILWHMVWP